MADEEQWLDETEQAAWRGFLAMHAHLSARMSQELQRTAGLSLADYDVLVHLTDVPDGRRRSFELGRSLDWEKSRLSKQVSRMEARGLVVREDCEEDRRGHFVVLTDEGRRAIERAAPPHVALVRDVVFDGLTAEQIRDLRDITTTVLARLQSGAEA